MTWLTQAYNCAADANVGKILLPPGWLVAIPAVPDTSLARKLSLAEPGHDPTVGYGLACLYPVPELNIFTRYGALHVWPARDRG